MRSVSTTTRSPRPGECDDVHYHFVSEEEFASRVEQGLFIEHATFGGKRYGTERRNIDTVACQGLDLLLAVDVQGVAHLKELYPSQVVCVFLFPPSFEELALRLRERGTESEEVQQRRLGIARQEMEVLRKDGFSDYLLVNKDLSEAVTSAHSILRVERLRFSRLSPDYLEELFASGITKTG